MFDIYDEDNKRENKQKDYGDDKFVVILIIITVIVTFVNMTIIP
jgi:hypothetical protein